MGIFNILGSCFGARGKGANGKCLYIVDAASLVMQNEKRRRLPPREQIALLKRLSRLVKKEGLDICAVFKSKPLRDAADKSDYHGVFVRYVPVGGKMQSMMLDLFKRESRRKKVVIVTGDKQLDEKIHQRGGVAMRVATFKKIVELDGGGARRQQSSDSRRRRKKNNPAKQNKPQQEKQAAPDSNPVSDLIDLVE